MKRTALCLIALLAWPMPATAQNAAKSKGPVLRLQVVISRSENDKKIGSAPYTLSLSPTAFGTPQALGMVGQIRTGVQVPIHTQGEKGPTTTYKDVGTSVDCRAETGDDGRYLVQCTLEQNSLYVPPATPAPNQRSPQGAGGNPVIRQFRSLATLLIGDGQTVQHSAGVDPATGEQVKVDITLNVLK